MQLLKVFKAILLSAPILLTSQLIKWSSLFIYGFIVAGLVNWIWWHRGYAGSKYDGELEFLEHYHWSMFMCMVSIVVSRVCDYFASVFYGITLIFWLDECFYQDHPFAINSGHEFRSDVIGVLLFFALVLVLFWRVYF